MKYALDTNTLSYWLQGNTSIAERISRAILHEDEIIIPPVAYYEILRGFKHKPAPKKEAAFSLICSTYGIGDMGIESWEHAAGIYGTSRKEGKPIEDTDILMAAFCFVNGCTLVTNNAKHFDGIEGLHLENWAENP